MFTVIISIVPESRLRFGVGERALWVNVWIHVPPPHLLLSRRGLSLALSMWAGLQAAHSSSELRDKAVPIGTYCLKLSPPPPTPTPSHLKINLQIIKMCHPEGIRNGVKKKE